MKISWNGFSKKSYQERLELLQAQALLSPDKQASLDQDEQISVSKPMISCQLVQLS